jgi:poly(3-hydroxybutyrate) depolymerase
MTTKPLFEGLRRVCGTTVPTHQVRKAAILRGLVAAVALSAAAAGAAAAPPPYNTSQQVIALPSAKLEIFTYRPSRCQVSSLLVVFHGLHRNAAGYRDDMRAIADANCMLVVAPLFDEERFPSWRYQLGGIVDQRGVQDPSNWTGKLVLELVQWVRKEERRPLDYYLIGHSAGAQFLSRVAAFMPNEARRIVIANPSTHVFPTLQVAAPFGLGGIYGDKDAQAQLRRYLEQPVTIFLGEADVGDKDLSETPSAIAQGRTRLERGLNVYREARKVAAEHGWRFNWRLVEIPGIGHSARKMFSSPDVIAALRP